jgi:hypothetical protein
MGDVGRWTADDLATIWNNIITVTTSTRRSFPGGIGIGSAIRHLGLGGSLRRQPRGRSEHHLCREQGRRLEPTYVASPYRTTP